MFILILSSFTKSLMILFSNLFILAYLSPPFDRFCISQFPSPLVLTWLIILHLLVPIYLLLDFKYSHFGSLFVFYSKVVFFSSLVTNFRSSDLVPHAKNGSNWLLQEVESKNWRPHQTQSCYSQEVQPERCLHQKCWSFKDNPYSGGCPSVVKW